MGLAKFLLGQGVKSADELGRLIMPALRQLNDPLLAEKAISGLRRMGAKVPSLPGPGLIGESPDATRRAIQAVRSTQAPTPEFGVGAIPEGAQPDTLLSRIRQGRTGAGYQGPAPRGAEDIMPIEGTQLRLPLTQPGKGGQIYSPMKSSTTPENAGTYLQKSIMDETPTERFIRAADEASEFNLTGVPRDLGFQRAPGIPDPLRPQGVQITDLGELLNDPRIRAAVGATGVAAAMPLISQILSEREATPNVTSEVPAITPFEETQLPVAPNASTDPAVSPNITTTGNLERESTAREMLAQSDPVAAAVMRATEPMSPERYKSPSEYFAAREAYAQQAPIRKELSEFMRGQQTERSGDLEAWAQANPALAYELQRRQLANPMANQQSAESITTTEVTTELGSDTERNMIGNAESTADAALTGTAGSFDLQQATSPSIKPNLQRVRAFLEAAEYYR